MTSEERAWWKEAVIYQVYPRSFQDSDGDGLGDVPGVLERVDHVADLGVDVVWLNPVYESPGVDAGYDISDYRAIDPELGSMDDWERLLDALHERDVRLVMDIAVNHTSDRHEWFQRSREDPDGPYGDFYHWHEGRVVDGERRPPNNWTSGFGGSAWAWDDEREAYYLHLFDERQPDLDWRNPAVRDAVHDVFQWWLRKGIDGFRLDVMNLVSKPAGYPDGDPDVAWVGAEHFMDGPRIHEYLTELYDAVFADRDVLVVAEMPGLDVDEADRYLRPDGDGFEQVFHFDHVGVDWGEDWWDVTDVSLPDLKAVFTRWQNDLEGWPGNYLGNHDQPRSVSRFGDDGQYRVRSQKLLGTFLFTLRGSPYVYQGEEIGMTNYPFESLEEIRDADARNRIEHALAQGRYDSFADVADVVRYRCRDNSRTPMQWDDSEHAGFTDGDPWLPVNPNYRSVNVERDREADDSIFAYYQALIALRDDHETLVYGDYELHLPDHERLYVYSRTDEANHYLVALNWSRQPVTLDLPDSIPSDRADLLLANCDVTAGGPDGTELRPWEARVYALA